MARGLFAGFITGSIVSVLGLGAVSLLMGFPEGSPPVRSGLEAPAGHAAVPVEDGNSVSKPASGSSNDAAEAPTTPGYAPDRLGLPQGALESTPRPEAGTVGGLSEPPAEAQSSIKAPGAEDTPIEQVSKPSLKESPPAEPSPSISAAPAQPEVPAVTGADEQAAPATVSEADSSASAETADTGSDVSSEAQPPAGSVFPQEEPSPSLVPENGVPDAGLSETVSPDEGAANGLANRGGLFDQNENLPKTLPGSGRIENRASGVTTGRLPTVSGGEGTEIAAIEAPDVKDEGTTQKAATLPPDAALLRNGVRMDNTGGKPLMAIVLIDDGSSPIGLEALQSFPYPLNFAVDASWSGAAEAAQRYRDLGFEVLAMTDLPAQASASDVEVAMRGYLAAIPQAVAVLEGEGSGLQSSPEAAKQLAPILMESGHGLVMRAKGLNTLQKLIAREGVPSASVFRDFDGHKETSNAIRRTLDQAVMKARQSSGVIMLGRMQADTISALLLWGLQDRSSDVALAPISALLLEN